MYESFYGLRERPFELLPNPKFLFLTSRQREALSNLQYGLTAARGLTVLIGEAGTGKTTSLVERMANLVRSDRARASSIAAITFTVKAAAHLREAFQEKLEREACHPDRELSEGEGSPDSGGFFAVFAAQNDTD